MPRKRRLSLEGGYGRGALSRGGTLQKGILFRKIFFSQGENLRTPIFADNSVSDYDAVPCERYESLRGLAIGLDNNPTDRL